MLQATIANVNRSKKQKAFEPDQFLPRWGRAREVRSGPMTGEEMLAAVKSINRKMGGTQGVNAG